MLLPDPGNVEITIFQRLFDTEDDMDFISGPQLANQITDGQELSAIVLCVLEDHQDRPQTPFPRSNFVYLPSLLAS